MAEPSEPVTIEGRTIDVKTILDIIQCSVCWDILKYPFKQCHKGHLICGDCFGKVRECPTCQEKCFINDPTCIKNLLEIIVPQPCRYHRNGCNRIVEPQENHEDYCIYRTVKCLKTDCPHRVPLILLMDHYDECHSTNVILFTTTDTVCWPNYSYEEEFQENLPIFTEYSLFWLQAKFQADFFEISFHMHPYWKLTKQYFIEITMQDGEQGHVYKIKASNKCGVVDESACFIMLHKSLMRWFGDRNEVFHFKYNIYTK